jgi:hypothetical protein
MKSNNDSLVILRGRRILYPIHIQAPKKDIISYHYHGKQRIWINKRGNLNFWCLGEGQVSYLPIDQKFIGVVSTETEI